MVQSIESLNFSALTVTGEDGVWRVEMRRPEVNNAFDDTVIQELITAFNHLSNLPSCRVAVLCAAGKHFSAGADLRWMKKMAQMDYEQNQTDALELANLMHTLYHFPKPLIGRVQGAAYGGAIGLIACCDIVVAENQAQFCLSEVKLGLSPAVISPYVIHAIGARQAQYYFLTAERFSANQAQELNLVHRTCALEDLDTEINQLTTTLLKNGPGALAASKQLVRKWSESSFTETLTQYTANVIAGLRVSQEGQEGMAAFFEKRPPNWPTK